ncbi:MAG: DUF58 domain-containing protein [Chloroflexi bacterium]|nr:DUF58 domain-containing protein [Chloroflexota bacterium]
MPFRDAWLLVGGLLVVIGFGAAEPVISAVGFVIILVGGVSRYWSRHVFDRVSLTRKLGERRTFIDEAVSLDVALENRKPLPLPWYQWRLGLGESFRMDGEGLTASAVPGLSYIVRRGALSWYGRHDWRFQLRSGERGYHQVGPATLRSSDIFGVFPRIHEDEQVQHLVVFPHVFPLEELGLPAERPFGEFRGRNRMFEDPLRVAGLRDYRPGDSLRRIDWKATARRGDLQSRVYEPPATQQLYLLVNIDTMEKAWEGYLKDELELTVSVAASVAVWAAGSKLAVGILANGSFPGSDRPIRLAPSRSRDQLTRILEALAVIQPLTLGDLAGAIHREGGRMPAGSTIVVVASLVPEPLAAAVRRLAAEGHEVFVLATSSRVDPSHLPGISVRAAGKEFSRPKVTA